MRAVEVLLAVLLVGISVRSWADTAQKRYACFNKLRQTLEEITESGTTIYALPYFHRRSTK